VSDPTAINDKKILRDLLDRHRAALLRTVQGLTIAQCVAVHVPSGTTLAGIVSHLAWMERWWFEATFAGEAVQFPWTDEDPDADWRPGATEDVDEIVERYRRAVRRSKRDHRIGLHR
jgi:hypothetical protein